jgi:hypothetical protein
MDGNNGYAVFFFPQALEALGDAIKPYLQDGPGGQHVICTGIDTGGALIELTLNGKTTAGEQVAMELMVPSGMVRMIVSARSDELFGFGPHALKSVVQQLAPVAGPSGTGKAEPEQPSGEQPQAGEGSKPGEPMRDESGQA